MGFRVEGQNKKPHYHVAAGLIWNKGNVLITKRPKGSHLEGLWEFPGGKQERGEGLTGCLEREIREELGLRVRAEQPFMTVGHEYAFKVISLHVFNCTIVVGEPRPLECQEIRWVPLSGLAEYDFLPPHKQVIKTLTNSGSGTTLD